MFPEVELRLANGGIIHIRADGASALTPFVQSMHIKGLDHNSPWIQWNDIEKGGNIDFVLGSTPALSWGSRREAAAPSFDSGDAN